MATAEKTINPEHVSSKQQLSRENTPDSSVVQELRRQVANAFVLSTIGPEDSMLTVQRLVPSRPTT